MGKVTWPEGLFDERDWTILATDGMCRVLPSGSPAEERSVPDGWRPLERFRGTRFEGWTRGVVEHGLVPEDYDDPMLPTAMPGPTVLHRSVSLSELDDIARTGAVTGAGNRFNGFDRRPFVFFSHAPTAQCIGQGEDVARAAAGLLRNHPSHATIAALPGRERALRAAFEPRARAHVLAVDRERARRGRGPLLAEEEWDTFSDPGSVAFRIATEGCPDVDGLRSELAGLRREHQEIEAALRSLHVETAERLREEAGARGFTSAVIETRPQSIGLHYSLEHGRTGMNGEDEYGLFPGQVRSDDIVSVTIVREGVSCERMTFDECRDFLAMAVVASPAP